jgi:predicted Holliday junction resolvase-like endonuclease
MEPSGFWSYARNDDRDLDKALSNLRMRVERRIRLVLGIDATVFQDIYDIRSGDNWNDILAQKLDAASFLIPVVTPRFLRSEWCREEVLTYCRAAEEQGHRPVLFPIYFIQDRRFDSNDEDEVIQKLRTYQYFDFRELQFETEERVIDREIHKLAEAIEIRLHEARSESVSTEHELERPPDSAEFPLEPFWQPGDRAPRHVRFIGFPATGKFIHEGFYREGDVYEVCEFDGQGEAPFRVMNDKGFSLWGNKRAFRVVD